MSKIETAQEKETKRARAMYFKVKLPLSMTKYSMQYRIAPTTDSSTKAN